MNSSVKINVKNFKAWSQSESKKIYEERFDYPTSLIQVSEIEAELVAGYFYEQCYVEEATKVQNGHGNANFIIKSEMHKDYKTKSFLRIYSFGIEAAKREIAVMEIARESGVRVPKLYDLIEDAGGRVAGLFEYIEGSTLGELLLSKEFSPLECKEIFRSLGKQVAATHKIVFRNSGLFNASAKIDMVFEQPANEARNRITTLLEDNAGRRLGNHKERLIELVDKNWSIAAQSYAKICSMNAARLVHGDLNPSNILIDRDNKVYLTDWEYSFAGNSLTDLGSLFRFEEDFTEEQYSSFIEGYKSQGLELPLTWRAAAKLLEVANLCMFLNSEEELEKTHRTAREQILSTIIWFSQRESSE